MKIWKSIATGGVVLGVFGIITAVSRRRVSAPTRVALIGDSYAVGLGPELAKAFPDFQFEGHVGTRPSQWAAHSAACGQCGDWLTAFNPEVTLVSLGINDGDSPDLKSYQAIVRALHGIGTRVVWIEPPSAVDAPAVRAAIASLGVDTIPATATPLAPDKLHPISYAGWAQEIAQKVSLNG